MSKDLRKSMAYQCFGRFDTGVLYFFTAKYSQAESIYERRWDRRMHKRMCMIAQYVVHSKKNLECLKLGRPFKPYVKFEKMKNMIIKSLGLLLQCSLFLFERSN